METVVLSQLESLRRELASLAALCEQLRLGHNELAEWNDVLVTEVRSLSMTVSQQKAELAILRMEQERVSN